MAVGRSEMASTSSCHQDQPQDKISASSTAANGSSAGFCHPATSRRKDTYAPHEDHSAPIPLFFIPGPTCSRTCSQTCSRTCDPTCPPPRDHTCPPPCAQTCAPTCSRTCPRTCSRTRAPTCDQTCDSTCD